MRVTKEKMLPYPPERVWKALTDPTALKSWFMVTDFKAEAGQSFYFNGGDDLITGEVLESVEPKRLVYSWKKNKFGLSTTVTWSLEETQGGTLLKLVHDGFGDKDRQQYDSHNNGWSYFLDKMAKFLEQSKTAAFPKG